MSEPMALPDRIDRYRVIAELGRGAMGRVYLAEDPRIGRRIALKVLAHHEALSEEKKKELLRRFLSEARAAGCLNHPGIVTVFDANTDPLSGAPYLVMEWIEGRTLSRLLHEEGTLPISRVVGLVAQVASALDHAHRQSVIHRDIKPANLLVTSGDAVKVTDFGIAKLRSQSLTMTGQMIGTPFYMAPEQITGDPVDGRADLFALGVVLYECLTGEIAFHGDTLVNITHKILSEDPRPAKFFNPDIPKRLHDVLDRALEKRAENRFQTGGELERELRAVAEELSNGRQGLPRQEADAGGGRRGEHPLDGSTVSLTPAGVELTAGAEGKPRAGWLRRFAGLAALAFLLPLFTTLALRTVQEQRPEWLADAPRWVSEIPAWTEEPGRLSELRGWINDLADRLSEFPGRFADQGESLGTPPVVDPPNPAGPPAARLEKPDTGPSAADERPSVPADLGPVPPPRPYLPRSFLTLEDLVARPPESPPDLVTRQALGEWPGS